MIDMKLNGSILDAKHTRNTLSLVSAFVTMLMLISGLPLKNKFCELLVMQLIYTAVGSVGIIQSRYVNLNDILMSIWFWLLIVVSLLNVVGLVVLVLQPVTGNVKERNYVVLMHLCIKVVLYAPIM